MNFEIQLGPGSAIAKVSLAAGEKLTTEGGAMVAMSPTLSVETSVRKKEQGGFKAALKRIVSGESFFMNHYTANAVAGEIYLSTTLPGDMKILDLSAGNIIVQGGSYVASTNDVKVDMSFQGLQSLFSGESLFWLKLSGQGKAIVNSFGAIYPVQIDGEYIVDTGHIVAFDETLHFTISKAGKSIISSFLGGEGLVCKFKGKGMVWCQSHNPNSFGGAMSPILKPIKR
jgi:uncharacterized protein (TIGR00266 family)